jgi:peptidyl-Lys metalloendopeptidase
MRSLSVIALFVAIACSTPVPKAKDGGPPLKCTIEARDTYFMNDRVVVLFLLENRVERDLQALKWSNPLEGLRAKIFRVRGPGGAELAYQGPLVRRGAPKRSSYETIEAGKTVIAKVDLASAYRFERRGTYTVEFTGGINDHAWGDTTHVAPPGDFEALPLDCNRVRFQMR